MRAAPYVPVLYPVARAVGAVSARWGGGSKLHPGLRPSVAAPATSHMRAALGREQDLPKLVMMRRLIELERGRGHVIER